MELRNVRDVTGDCDRSSPGQVWIGVDASGSVAELFCSGEAKMLRGQPTGEAWKPI